MHAFFAPRYLAACAFALSVGTSIAAGPAVHWDYRSHGGPGHWGALDPGFEACARGRQQSPIDIRRPVTADLPAVDPRYQPVTPTLVNNGHTVQVNVPPGQYLVVGEARYELLQFHFHTPSEESVAGRRTAMVAHFVHRNDAGELGVFAVMLRAGKGAPAYRDVFEHLPRHGERIEVENLVLDLRALLPKRLGYYTYEGSLTTPPCTEGVRWHVFHDTVTLTAAQIKAFRRMFPANARPLQPVNGRAVRSSA